MNYIHPCNIDACLSLQGELILHLPLSYGEAGYTFGQVATQSQGNTDTQEDGVPGENPSRLGETQHTNTPGHNHSCLKVIKIQLLPFVDKEGYEIFRN